MCRLVRGFRTIITGRGFVGFFSVSTGVPDPRGCLGARIWYRFNYRELIKFERSMQIRAQIVTLSRVINNGTYGRLLNEFLQQLVYSQPA